MEEQLHTLNNEQSGLSVKDLFYKYLRFLPLFLISVALSLFVAFVYLRYSTLIYSASGSLIIKDDQPLKGDDKFAQAFSNDDSKNIQNEIEVLKSRPLMERVVNSLHLNLAYIAKGNVKELNIYKSCPFYVEAFEIADSASFFSMAIEFAADSSFTINGENNKLQFGKVFKNHFGVFRLVRRPEYTLGTSYIVNWRPTFNLASQLASDLAVAPKSQGTGILILSLETDNPQYTADVINQVMKEYQILTLEDKNQTNQRSKAFIDERLKVVAHELDSINGKRLGYMQSNNIIDPEAQGTSYLDRITETDQAVNQQRTQLEIVQLIDQYLRDKRNSLDPVPSSLGIQDPTLNAMITAYNVAQLEYKSLLDGNVPKGNILVKEKEGEIEKLRTNILENLRNVRSSYYTTIKSLQQQGNMAQNRAKELPAKQQVLQDIEREQASKLAVYNYLMEKREEAAIALASNITSSKIIDEAHPDYTPVKPNRHSIQGLAVAVGIVVPALFIFLLEVLNDKVTTRQDVEKLTRAAILGEVGHSFGKETLMVTTTNRGVIAEQFRIIRSNFQYVLNHIQKPVLMVTSSFSGEGKSFISTNTGAVMALAGKKTIILEFDIRKPKILSGLNISKKPGLTNFLLGKSKMEDLPIPVEGTPNLFILPCGPVPPNPAELLLDTRLNDLFAWLKVNFDVVIMDTAPVGMVSDAMTLSKFADCTLYIVRQGHTFKKQISLIDEFYTTGKLPKISIILNDVKIRTGYGYYGYGRYGYGYGYGSGYFEDETPPTFLQRWFGWMDLARFKKKKRKKVNL